MMIDAIAAGAAVLLYLFLYYAVGSIVISFRPAEEYSFSKTTFLGFFVYHFLFFAVAIPMKLTLQPLSRLTAVWTVILVLITVFFLVREHGQLPLQKKRFAEVTEKRQILVTLVFLLVILVQAVWFNLNDETYAIWDQSYYLGDTATSLYTNTISQYNPYTGKILEHLNTEYLFETLQNHSAVMSQLLHIHPMVETLTVTASTVIILYQLIMYQIGCRLFHGNRARAVTMTAFLFLLNIFSYNLFTAAEFLIIRPSEGKTVLAVLILPALLYFFLTILDEPEKKTGWLYSFLVILGSFGLNMSSIYMIPFEITAFYLPLAVHRKSLSVVRRWLILLIPCVIMSVLYLLTKDTLLIYTKVGA